MVALLVSVALVVAFVVAVELLLKGSEDKLATQRCKVALVAVGPAHMCGANTSGASLLLLA